MAASTKPPPKQVQGDWLTRSFSAVAWACLLASSCLFVLALLALGTGDGVSDAAPWWLFLGLLAAIVAVPGFFLRFVARLRRKPTSSSG